jgi:hypothetical protein
VYFVEISIRLRFVAISHYPADAATQQVGPNPRFVDMSKKYIKKFVYVDRVKRERGYAEQQAYREWGQEQEPPGGQRTDYVS